MRCYRFGARLGECLAAADELAGFGLPTTVADARFAKPLDLDLIRDLAKNHEVLHHRGGGVYRRLRRSRAARSWPRTVCIDGALKVRTLVLPDRFIDQGKPAAMYAAAGLDADGIIKAVFTALGKNDKTGAARLA